MPNNRERFSSNPPATAPSMFAPSAALGDSASRNSAANRTPANTTGSENTSTAIVPASAADRPIRSKGNQYASPSPASKAANTQNRGTALRLRSTHALASNNANSSEEIPIPFTCHTVPKNNARRLITCVSSNKNPAPMEKKNKDGRPFPTPPICRYNQLAIRITSTPTE